MCSAYTFRSFSFTTSQNSNDFGFRGRNGSQAELSPTFGSRGPSCVDTDMKTSNSPRAPNKFF